MWWGREIRLHWVSSAVFTVEDHARQFKNNYSPMRSLGTKCTNSEQIVLFYSAGPSSANIHLPTKTRAASESSNIQLSMHAIVFILTCLHKMIQNHNVGPWGDLGDPRI